MRDGANEVVPGPYSAPKELLTEELRGHAKAMLARAIRDEVAVYVDEHAEIHDAHGHGHVVRSSRHRSSTMATRVGSADARQARVYERRVDENSDSIGFNSKLLPKYLRSTKSLAELIPWLDLTGSSTGDSPECLQRPVGAETASLSPTAVVRLKEPWIKEQRAWARRSLEGKRYVYIWGDGIHFNIRLEGDCQYILMILEATSDGRKELLAIRDGDLESEQSWKDLLLDLRPWELEHPPGLAIGDGGLGFWKALTEVCPSTRIQRCWVHTTSNVLNKLPKSWQASAKSALQDNWIAETCADANEEFDRLEAKRGDKHSRSVDCLGKDREEVLAFYACPSEHWRALRTTKPIESIIATVRLRYQRTKGSGLRNTYSAMAFELVQSAAQHWRRLAGQRPIADVVEGVGFNEGLDVGAA